MTTPLTPSNGSGALLAPMPAQREENRMNIAIIQGTVVNVRVVEYPSSTVTQLDVAPADVGQSVPVAWHKPTFPPQEGDEVLVVGRVARRFFRAGGATQSRTEVSADAVTLIRGK